MAKKKNQDSDKKDKSKDKQEDKLKEKEEKIQELTETLQRVQAEFENYRKQVEKREEMTKKRANKELIKEILPILDNFSLALKNKDGKEFKEGIELIYSELFSILEEEGVKAIEAEGKEFDPRKHEALLKEKSKEPKNTVIEVLQKGYMLKDEVLRPSKVKVSDGPKKSDKDD